MLTRGRGGLVFEAESMPPIGMDRIDSSFNTLAIH